MSRRKLSRVTRWVLCCAGVFLLALAVTSASLIWRARTSELIETEEQAVRFINGAETSVNRSLLGVDVLLASMDDLLGLSSLVPDRINTPTANQLMRVAANLNLLVQDIALIDAQGKVLASSSPSGTELAFNLPSGFVQAALAPPISTMMISAPMTRLTSADRVLYLARHLKFADGSKVLAVAEVHDWRLQRNFILGVTLLFALMILAAGGFAIWHLNRLAQARRSILQSKATLDQALGSMVTGFMLLNADHQVVSWNQRFLELYPWLAGVMKPLLPFQKALEIFSVYHLPQASAVERQEWIKRRIALQRDAQGAHEQIFPTGQVIEITERRTPEGGWSSSTKM